jgi:hypothetical protein
MELFVNINVTHVEDEEFVHVLLISDTRALAAVFHADDVSLGYMARKEVSLKLYETLVNYFDNGTPLERDDIVDNYEMDFKSVRDSFDRMCGAEILN